MKNLTVPIEVPSVGINRTRTFDRVSPTTVLYEIIAEIYSHVRPLNLHTRDEAGTYPKRDKETAGTRGNNIHSYQMRSPSHSRSYDVPTSELFLST